MYYLYGLRALAFASLLLAGIIGAGLTTKQLITTERAGAASQVLYVSPDGSDANSGALAAPLKTIQKALDLAAPGTVINLGPGQYNETLTTKTNGTSAEPIVIRGSDVASNASLRYKTVLYNSGRIVNVNHSYYRFEGFSIDGQKGIPLSSFPTDPANAYAFKLANRAAARDGRLIYIGSADSTRDLTGITVANMFLHGAGGECVRIRNAASYVTISDTVIQWCGMFYKDNSEDGFPFHHGEGVYVGTSPNSTSQPMYNNDTSHHVIVTSSTIHTYGSECFDVKENAHDNTLSNSDCAYNIEPAPDGSNIEFRGYNNSVFNTNVRGTPSVNVKIQANSSSFNNGGNIVRYNVLSQALTATFRVSSLNQGAICGNTISLTSAPVATGNYASSINPTATCNTGGVIVAAGSAANVTPVATASRTPTPQATATKTPTSTPTRTPVPSSTALAPLVQQKLTIEAESGPVTAPMTLANDTGASGGTYVVSSKDEQGALVLTVVVPAKGKYVLSGRVIAPSGSKNSFYYTVDGASKKTWNLPDTLRTWTWADGPTLDLTAGQHTLLISGREADTRLDAIGLTLK